MKKIISLLLIVTVIAMGLVGCKTEEKKQPETQTKTEDANNNSNNDNTNKPAQEISGQINVSGSTSMEKVAKALAEGFMAKNDKVSIDVQLGGSSTGVNNVIDGISDVGNASRGIKDKEKEAGINEYKIAIDGIAVIVNNENSVTDLTLEQIAAIYKGEIANWSEVGGADAEVVVVGREAGSGTRDGFEEIVDIKDQAVYKSELNETGQVKNLVSTTPGAIGYISLDYADDSVKLIKVNGVDATAANIQAGSYPIQRPFMMVTKGESAQTKAFLDYILSPEGQEIVVAKGCISVLN